MRGRVFDIITRPRRLPKKAKVRFKFYCTPSKKLLFSKPSISPPQSLKKKKSLKPKQKKLRCMLVTSNAKLRKFRIRSQRSPISEMTEILRVRIGIAHRSGSDLQEFSLHFEDYDVEEGTVKFSIVLKTTPPVLTFENETPI
jgi:hypothetical protein